MKPNLAELMLMNSMLEPESKGNKSERILHNGLTGKQWTIRKSRSRIVKQSRKRNR